MIEVKSDINDDYIKIQIGGFERDISASKCSVSKIIERKVSDYKITVSVEKIKIK